eukprot:TRINITY_DN12124_c0_g1_i1.p1 TRINITY_DN12124_c0_g1~~TRINITY_DN12124_c0_g1_i1.p1  ORF type:complete len:258 (-),score=58.39 TRINITY_DN12124_c0_g1_i1:666-1415(-)
MSSPYSSEDELPGVETEKVETPQRKRISSEEIKDFAAILVASFKKNMQQLPSLTLVMPKMSEVSKDIVDLPRRLEQERMDTLIENKGYVPKRAGTIRVLPNPIVTTHRASDTPSTKKEQAKDKKGKKKEKKEKGGVPGAGGKWFDMRTPEVTPELHRELELFQLRNYVDPRKHVKGGYAPIPKVFEVGTVVESSADYYRRTTKKEKKQNFSDYLLKDEKIQRYINKRTSQIEENTLSKKRKVYKKKSKK